MGSLVMKKWVCQNCKLNQIKQQAEADGLTMTIQASVDDVGFDVFVHPNDVIIPSHVYRRDRGDLPEAKYFQTWLFNDYDKRGCRCDE